MCNTDLRAEFSKWLRQKMSEDPKYVGCTTASVEAQTINLSTTIVMESIAALLSFRPSVKLCTMYHGGHSFFSTRLLLILIGHSIHCTSRQFWKSFLQAPSSLSMSWSHIINIEAVLLRVFLMLQYIYIYIYASYQDNDDIALEKLSCSLSTLYYAMLNQYVTAKYPSAVLHPRMTLA